MKVLSSRKLKIILCIISVLCTFLALKDIKWESAKAQTSAITPTIYTPLTAMEYTDLNEPKDFCFFNGNLAVIEGQSVVIHFADGTKKAVSTTGLTALKQIKAYKNDLLISSNGSLYVLSLTDYSIKPLTYVNSDGVLINVGGNYFDFNGTYLVTVYGQRLDCYVVSESQVLHKFGRDNADGDEPVAINSNGEIFYVTGDTEKILIRRNVENVSHADELAVNVNPSILIADNDYVYYESLSGIYRLPVTGGNPTQLPFNEEYKNYDLGYIKNGTQISGINFNNGNLLISCPELNSIQEYKIEDDNLRFTGYAITKNKTAYNRINKDATDVEHCGNTLAVLDPNKLTVILNAEELNYSKENYFNYLFPTDFRPNRMALSNKTVLLCDIYTKKLIILNYKTGETILNYTFEAGNNLIDVCYQNGAYYVNELKTGSGNDVNVYKIVEEEINQNYTVSAPIFTATSYYDSNSHFTVDIFGNVYISGKDGKNIYKYIKTADGYTFPTTPEYANVTPTKKLTSDLNGRIFGITDGSVLYYVEKNEYNVGINLSEIESIALTYDCKSVYFISPVDERIYSTDQLPNASADRFIIPEGFGQKQDSANVDDLKIYSISEQANLFAVSIGENEYFNYEGIYQNVNDEYAIIGKVLFSVNDLPPTEYGILLGYDKINQPILVIALTSDLIEKTQNVKESETDSSYVATDVSLYFIPLITETDDFVVERNGESLRLEKNTLLYVQKEINFLNKTFYFVTVNIDGTEISGYTPKDFTTLTLYQNPPTEQINVTLKDQNKHTLRNALVTLIVATSVFATSIFFITRKKKS